MFFSSQYELFLTTLQAWLSLFAPHNTPPPKVEYEVKVLTRGGRGTSRKNLPFSAVALRRHGLRERRGGQALVAQAMREARPNTPGGGRRNGSRRK
jgi:hypothetical protein